MCLRGSRLILRAAGRARDRPWCWPWPAVQASPGVLCALGTARDAARYLVSGPVRKYADGGIYGVRLGGRVNAQARTTNSGAAFRCRPIAQGGAAARDSL